VCYLQEAFNIDSDKHALILEEIKGRKVKQNMHKSLNFVYFILAFNIFSASILFSLPWGLCKISYMHA
jgi:hypothetical protein